MHLAYEVRSTMGYQAKVWKTYTHPPSKPVEGLIHYVNHVHYNMVLL